MKFHKDDLEKIEYFSVGKREGGYEVVERQMVAEHRWEIEYTHVFKFRDKFYRMNYRVPATEMQEGMDSYYEDIADEDGMIQVPEVFPVQKTITVYE